MDLRAGRDSIIVVRSEQQYISVKNHYHFKSVIGKVILIVQQKKRRMVRLDARQQHPSKQQLMKFRCCQLDVVSCVLRVFRPIQSYLLTCFSIVEQNVETRPALPESS